MRKTKAQRVVDLKSLARSYTETAIKTLAHVMMQPKASSAARVAAAQALLDRGWGKPTQTIEAEVAHRFVARMPGMIADADEWQAHFDPTIQ